MCQYATYTLASEQRYALYWLAAPLSAALPSQRELLVEFAMRLPSCSNVVCSTCPMMYEATDGNSRGWV
jgi:hypothetical protein